jgi:hypothetical protein
MEITTALFTYAAMENGRKCFGCRNVDEIRRTSVESTLNEEDGHVLEEDTENSGATITTTSDEAGSTDQSESEPDWDSEKFSLRYLNWWQDRFLVDKEEREGCPLAPKLALVISEEPHVNEKLGELHQPREDILQGEENE